MTLAACAVVIENIQEYSGSATAKNATSSKNNVL
jgi:hypothetical protein